MPRVLSRYVPCQNKGFNPSARHLYLIPNSKRLVENITWPLVNYILIKELRNITRYIMGYWSVTWKGTCKLENSHIGEERHLFIYLFLTERDRAIKKKWKLRGVKYIVLETTFRWCFQDTMGSLGRKLAFLLTRRLKAKSSWPVGR